MCQKGDVKHVSYSVPTIMMRCHIKLSPLGDRVPFVPEILSNSILINKMSLFSKYIQFTQLFQLDVTWFCVSKMVSLFMGKYKHPQLSYMALEFITKVMKKDSVPIFMVYNQLFTFITLNKIHHTMFPKFFC